MVTALNLDFPYDITELAKFEETHKDHQIQLLAMQRTTPKSHIMCPRVLSKCFWNSLGLHIHTTRLTELMLNECIQ